MGSADDLTNVLKYATMGYMAIDWTKIYEKYKGLWVALKDDEKTVVGVGKSAQEALTEVHKNGYQEPILTRMPESLVTFVG
jgi:hypothetical protein